VPTINAVTRGGTQTGADVNDAGLPKIQKAGPGAPKLDPGARDNKLVTWGWAGGKGLNAQLLPVDTPLGY
jgi:hypothetical protein